MVGTCVENKFVPEKSRKSQYRKNLGTRSPKNLVLENVSELVSEFQIFSHTWKSFQFPKITLLKVKRRCFEVTLRKFQVQIGAQGTDDDVRLKVISLMMLERFFVGQLAFLFDTAV